jgi:adenylate cyclase
VIEPALQVAEIRRSAARPTNDLTAYDLFLRALALAFTLEKGAILQSLDLLERASGRDPHYGRALVGAALRHYELHVNGWADDPEASRRHIISRPPYASALANTGRIHFWVSAWVISLPGGSRKHGGCCCCRRKRDRTGCQPTDFSLPAVRI